MGISEDFPMTLILKICAVLFIQIWQGIIYFEDTCEWYMQDLYLSKKGSQALCWADMWVSSARTLHWLILAMVLCSHIHGCHGRMDQWIEKGVADVSQPYEQGCCDELEMTSPKTFPTFILNPEFN